MKATDLDKKFNDNQKDILEHFDLANPRFINEKPKRVNIDFPKWMVQSLDKEAKHIGISRQAVVKMWISDRLKTSIR